MKEQLIVKNLPFIKILPAWAQELSYKYCSKTANLYIMHGNIRDFLPHKMNEGEFNFVKIQDYVSEVLFGNRDIIVFWDRSSGVSFCAAEMQRDYLKTMRERYPDYADAELFSADPAVAFKVLEQYFLLNIPQKKRIVLIIDYAETILPAGEVAKLDDNDRYCFVTLNRWSHDPVFTRGDVSIILLSENLSDLNPRVVASPSTIKVEIPIPDGTVRSSFLHYLDGQGGLLLDRGLSPEAVGAITSGLNLVNLNRMAAESWQEDKPINMDYLKAKKREIIEGEAGGLLEFLDTEHDLSYVSGHDFVRKRFKSAARALKLGRLDVLPMGYLIAGPVGTGKSFMVTAFAGEIGVPMVKFKNFRSKWQGVTESNLEKVLTILKAMAPVAVMIDEADAFLGDRNQDGDSGTSNRIFAQLANFMGNTEYRGKIIWFLITCRPDLLPIDLKRQGRAEEHLALFYPDSESEKIALYDVLVRKLDLQIRKFPISELLKKFKHEFSGADLESVLIRAKFKASMDNRSYVTREDLDETMNDFVPPAYPHEIDLQNLVAVLECTSKEMVPKRFQNLDRTKLVKDIGTLKSLLGEG
ncbi:MAG: AAA family ATPase [Spirochaetes bacterium GWD1_61_31]|nr:MAG: AAA family ATPase [Spirochaetes bacterium GWB1_60_80]OHD32668.1 MAG: AAA family ATPase [Spirochaetes bacterium GWC1_61_12]OHD39274.1 MAG: AAA family ATPase [Spirochaetes bacterium GWD1_61_31]OHD42092.1 MAG: AAA family ATPase [Spirochaetes bacterium GWE1_60_18]OHD60974.1 MAG: AAA family ATPase [Spirochaetes bacterium GWF1_60_12]HAP42780.1 AAA family ATPase [Spirochaetaceae bacterium]